MTDLAPTASTDFEVLLPSPARLVELRIGKGELLTTENGSACLVAGEVLPRADAATYASAHPELSAARVYSGNTDVQSTGYGVRLPLRRVQTTQDAEVYCLPLTGASTAQDRWTYLLRPDALQLTVRVAGADLLATAPVESLNQLVFTAYLLSGATYTTTFSLRVDNVAPSGTFTYALANGFGYLAYRDLSTDTASVTLAFADGSTLTLPLTASGAGIGVQLVEDPRAPVTVTATDRAGNVSGNLLARTTNAGRVGQGQATAFTSWPLPAYLNPRRPRLAALLRAAETALDVGPDRAGDSLSLDRAGGADLDELSLYFGTTRRPGEGDASLSTRIKARFLPHKASRGGLAVQLGLAGAPTARIADVLSQYTSARALDGSWTLDGSVRLGGEAVVEQVSPGVVDVVFSGAPASGWDAARKAVVTHTAAGVISHLLLDVDMRVSLGAAPRTDVSLTVPVTALQTLGTISDQFFQNPLTLDGSWTLDGSQTIDGSKDNPTPT